MLHSTELGLLGFMTFLNVKYCVRKTLLKLNHLYLVSSALQSPVINLSLKSENLLALVGD